MDLHYRYFGTEGNPPLVILHGLLGSSRNWLSVGKELVAQYEVFAVDLRNHGDSAHVDDMSFEAMAGDLTDFLNARGLDRVTLLGHSLGGKAAMRFACEHPERVAALVVVDIAPKVYPPHHQRDFEAMLALPVARMESRRDAEAFIAEYVMDWAQRQFLLTNLKRNEAGEGFVWGINLAGLSAGREQMRQNPLDRQHQYKGATLFITGAESNFVAPEDWAQIRTHFPRVRIQSIEGAGHNPHIDSKGEFLATLGTFLQTSSSSGSNHGASNGNLGNG